MTEIELGVMQLLNDSCFHVTTKANQLASGTGHVFRALTCRLQYDCPVQIRDPAGMEMPVWVTSIFLAGARVKNASYFGYGTLLLLFFKIRLLLT